MDADWTTSPSGHRVMVHADDPRPAWLWSQDGQRLIWSNPAAALFLAKVKKHGLKRLPMAVPIKGQVQRIIRLGSNGRSSLARIQFLAGGRPASATCSTTPLSWTDGQLALLIVGVDPIDAEVLEACRAEEQPAPESAAPQASAPVEPVVEQPAAPMGEEQAALDDWHAAKPEEPDASAWVEDERAEELPAPWLPEELEPADADPPPASPTDSVEQWIATLDETPTGEDTPSVGHRLSRLISLLSDEDDGEHASLAGATPDEEAQTVPPVDEDAPAIAEPTAEQAAPEPPAEDLALFRVVGRRLLEADQATTPALLDEGKAEAEAGGAEPAVEDVHIIPPGEAAAPPPSAPLPDADTVERVSRYNFDELARILTDRIGDAAPPPAPARSGELVALGGETLVLNRLPLGILVFRDQQVLFANRAITEMIGYDSVEKLRQAGLAAIFPGADDQAAGPVNHLVQRDGTLVPVTARLQSISWQGRPALMLSASATEVRTGHEAAVRAFAEAAAGLTGDGFIETTRTGVISAVSPRTRELLGDTAGIGRPLINLVAESERERLRSFLERPARFAETERPAETLRLRSGEAELTLFAQGQAGIVTGYFGQIRSRSTAVAPLRLPSGGGEDTGLLARISRGVRRPLNTIIGFSELIRSQGGAPPDAERVGSYAADITAAGQEIAALVDELEDYARLRDGRYLPQRASLDLTIMLESCVVRVRQQASGARVFVRSAISERLPAVTADRPSLEQAVLNLMSSAIDQTPTGGTVVLSAQYEDDGSISIHIRDGSTTPVDMAERFVVFRDGSGTDGKALAPVRSSVGLALTRSLLAVNTFTLGVDPAGEQGLLFTLRIPAECVEAGRQPGVAE